MSAALLDTLRATVGAAHVLTDGDLSAWQNDWRKRWHGKALAVVRPGSTDEVAAVVRACAAQGVAIVPQGGNTGLVGGGVPLAGEVVLSTTRLATMGAVDERAGQVTVGAGVTLATVQDEAAAVGLRYAVDLAARDTATVGGTVATNAGGVHVLRHGPTRAQVVGIEAVLGTGVLVAHHVLARLRLLRWAQRREVRVLVWTVDHPRVVRAALRDPRVWMVTTNHPAEAVALRDRLSR